MGYSKHLGVATLKKERNDSNVGLSSLRFINIIQLFFGFVFVLKFVKRKGKPSQTRDFAQAIPANTSSSDMDMMEAAPSAAASAVQDDSAAALLVVARQLVNQGKPSQALQAVVTAMKTTGGEGAVARILQRARELYRNKLMQARSEADELASLFAQCAIAEAQPEKAEPFDVQLQSLTESDAYKASILVQTGRKQIMLDASSDGSSFICLQCGGLVGSNRRDEHYAYWCQI
ncbi:hypothetical protein V2J09_007139 [Rumex salicifolius]